MLSIDTSPPRVFAHNGFLTSSAGVLAFHHCFKAISARGSTTCTRVTCSTVKTSSTGSR